MGEILSQNEIDALLAALSSGQVDVEENTVEEKQKAKKYDFKRPNKFSKEHVKTLEMVHDNFSRLVSNYLSAYLRSSVQINVISAEQITFEEFIHSIPNPTILISFILEPFNGVLLFETGPQFVFQVIDILFGGNGMNGIKTREFTEIEKNIIKRIDLKMLENLKTAWEDIIDVDVKFDNLETNPVLNQVMAPNEPVALITMAVNICNNQSFINMCIPYISIEKFMDKLVIQYRNSISYDGDEENRKKIQDRINCVGVDCEVVLGKSLITVEDFISLSNGDCITLNRKTKEPLDMYVEKKLHFNVYPGTISKRMGVQIVKILSKDVKDYE